MSIGGNMMAWGAEWHSREQRKWVAGWVSYQRGNVTHPVRATPDRSLWETQDQNGLVERWESRDFIISAIDLPFDPPERGDRIIETTAGGAVLTYEVLAPRGERVWKWDSFRTAMRIHTKLVSEV